MTPDRVAEALAALEAAEKGVTPGPWYVQNHFSHTGVDCGPDRIVALEYGEVVQVVGSLDCSQLSAEFIARWRNAAPALLAIAKKIAQVDACHAGTNCAWQPLLADLAEAVLGP